jgi:hypothetical protein
MKVHPLIWLVALPPAGISAQASVFEGGAGRAGDVLVVGATPERPAELQGIELQPIECIGRTQLTELAPDRPRLRADVPGASRVVLPRDHGSLYRYRRDEGSAQVYGYFLVGADGVARSVFELPGFGSAGFDPTPGRVAVSSDGTAILTATHADAGGDLWEIDLASGTAVNRTSNLAPQNFELNGLALLAGWGIGIAERGAFRFDRTPQARAGEVDVPGDPRWFGTDVVRSADESTVAFQAGDDDEDAFVFVCRRNGDAVKVSSRPADVTSAGFLPDYPAGPKMALSTDGSYVAWKVTGNYRECWVRETRTGSPPPPEIHVTRDELFYETLNDTGVIAFYDPDSFVFVVGLHAIEGIDRGDMYRVDLTPGSSTIQVTNLSCTSGIMQPPFDYGYLDTSYGLYQVPGSPPAYLIHAYYGDEEEVVWIDVAGAEIELLDEVESIDSLDLAGDYLVAGVTRPRPDDPQHDLLALLQIGPGGQEVTVAPLPDGCRLSRHVGSRSRNVFAAVLEVQGGEWLGRMQVPDPRGLMVSNSLLTYGPTTGATAGGEILASVQLGAAHVAFAWSDLGTDVLRSCASQCFVLPGL